MSMQEDSKLYHIVRMNIMNVADSDQGIYKAVAKNKHGEGVATINLNFEGEEEEKPK